MNSSDNSTANGSIYLCIKQFNARLGDELNLKIGDKVEVLADDSEYNDGWYMGKNLLTNDVGLYPKGFTQVLMSPKPEDALLRSRSRRVLSGPGSKKGLPNNSTLNKIADSMQNMSLSSDDESRDMAHKHGAGDVLEPGMGATAGLGAGLGGAATAARVATGANAGAKSDAAANGDPSGSSVHKTMSDIDKALQELRTESSANHAGEALNTTSTTHTSNTTNTPSSTKGHQRDSSATSLTENLDPHNAKNWSPQQVSSYFAMVLGFDMDVAGKFSRHKITGAILFELDLTYLKELDIDSFGTRFEVFKEIEKLKQLNSRAKNYGSSNRRGAPKIDEGKNSIIGDLSDEELASPGDSKFSSPYKLHSFPNNSDEDTNNTTYSKSNTQLMPSANLVSSTPSKRMNLKHDGYKTHQRKRSQSMENIPSGYNDTNTPVTKSGNEMSFASPRRAPEPPTANPMDDGYKFGAGPSSADAPNDQTGLYKTRNNASGTGLGISNEETSRPSSSVYEQSLKSHNRNMSAVSAKHHRRNSSYISGHKRNSSLFLFKSGDKNHEPEQRLYSKQIQKAETPKTEKRKSTVISPDKLKSMKYDSATPKSKTESAYYSLSPGKHYVDIDNANLSPKKLRSLSEEFQPPKKDIDEKRSASEANSVSRFKTLRTASQQNFRKTLKKLKTSAFTEGIREITPDEAIKAATFSGWMAKKSGSTLGWRSRYFTLHGTRLLYFTSLRDKRERGLIDITAHKVLPVNSETDSGSSNDKYIALYAASTGYGRYCFKLVPPAPGFKKGLTFTQPKTHYFAVESQEEMRSWLKALMTATIDIDDTVPVVSSCSTPTVTLSKAQELLSKAREETKLKDQELLEKGYLGNDTSHDLLDPRYTQFLNDFSIAEGQTSEENSPMIDSLDESTFSSQRHSSAPRLTVDTLATNYKSPSTPQVQSQLGFASPYLLASGLFSPKLNASGPGSSTGTPNLNPNVSQRSTNDYFPDTQSSNSEATPKLVFSNGRVISGASVSKKKSNPEKMLAYSNDGSGNHTFVIKPKK